MSQKSNNARQNFLQRRYAVSLGRRYVLAAAGVMLMGVIAGCSGGLNNSSNSVLAESPLTKSESLVSDKTQLLNPKLVSANTKFGFNLFSQLLVQEGNQNIFVSPTSIALALAMTYNGASGSTKQEMLKALELQGMNLQQINSAKTQLKVSLAAPDSQVTLNIANSLWADRNASLKPDFIRNIQEFYQGKVANLNFADASATKTINSWVKENTKNKIEKIIDKIDSDRVLLLLNAIYFKGSWTKEFEPDRTANYPFYLSSDVEKNHPMMSQSGNYRYYENEQFQAVSLPYGEKGRISFYVFLPKQNTNLSSFYKNLNASNWEEWMSRFTNREGFVRLPRLKIDYEATLNDVLAALGMEEAFSDRANFSEMGTNLKIGEVKHKTFVEVNEEGTESAATTSVGIELTSVQIPSLPPFQMIVNRPFFCAIRDNQTRSILVMTNTNYQLGKWFYN